MQTLSGVYSNQPFEKTSLFGSIVRKIPFFSGRKEVVVPDVISSTQTDAKMLANLRKAMAEHHRTEGEISKVLENYKERSATPLAYKIHAQGLQGDRPAMEDAHFYMQTSNGVLAGIFDGHGDKGMVSKLCKEMFEKEFFSELAKEGNVVKAFQNIINRAHDEVLKKGLRGGSTAVVAFIDRNNRLYVANVGDSEGVLFRNTKNGMEPLEMSRIYDWSKPKEAARAARALYTDPLEQQSLISTWTSYAGKVVRFPLLIWGINVSRAIGDEDDYKVFLKDPANPAIIHKASVSLYQMREGDLLVLGCDGLWDFASPAKVLNQVVTPNLGKGVNLADKLSRFAYKDCRSTDNISVISIQAQAAQRAVPAA